MAENIYELAQSFGGDPFASLLEMPKNISTPWSGQNIAPKNKQALLEYELKKGQKRLEDISKIVDDYKEPLDSMYEFLKLNKDLTVPSGWLSTPIPNFVSSTRQNMESISSLLAPRMRPSGSGTTSDRDIALYLKSTVGLDRSLEANTNIVANVQKRADKAVAKQKFFDMWLSKHQTLRGADSAWSKNQDKIMQIMYGPTGTKAQYYNIDINRAVPDIVKRNLPK